MTFTDEKLRSLKQTYQNQKWIAEIRRGIGWEFTFESWLQWWVASGKLDLRGRGKGRYVMSRIGDKGSYSPENCFPEKFEKNATIKNEETKKNVRNNLSEKARQYYRENRRYTINTPKGRYYSLRDAAKALDLSKDAISKRLLSTNFPDYYKTDMDGNKIPKVDKRKINKMTSKTIMVKTPSGVFESIKSAATHYSVSSSTISRWIKSEDNLGFGYFLNG